MINHQLAYRWYLQDGGFFDVYAPGHARIYFADDKSDVPSLADQHPGALIFDLSGDRAVQRQDLAQVRRRTVTTLHGAAVILADN